MSLCEAEAQPVRIPGPAILLKEPLLSVLPKSSGPGTGESVRSISISRGRSAWFNGVVGVGAGVKVVVGHWRKS